MGSVLAFCTLVSPSVGLGLWAFLENRLTKVKRSPPGADSLLLTYCGLGKRLKKTGTAGHDRLRLRWYVCGLEFDGSENLKARYVYANGLLLARMEVPPEDTSYYHHDGLGSTMGLTDEDGKVAQAYLYDEFGNLIESWGAVDNHYLYTGQEWDNDIATTELYNLRTRYYDTGIGRFVSEDPILHAGYAEGYEGIGCAGCGGIRGSVFMTITGSPQSLNAYPYVANNPVNLTDPLGTFELPCALRVFARNLIRLHFQPRFKGRAPFLHCLTACQLVTDCGLSPGGALGLGAAKEALDGFLHLLGRKATGWDWMDIVDDALALACAEKAKRGCTTCWVCCSSK